MMSPTTTLVIAAVCLALNVALFVVSLKLRYWKQPTLRPLPLDDQGDDGQQDGPSAV